MVYVRPCSCSCVCRDSYFSSSRRAELARAALYSKEYTCPLGATARASESVIQPDPVPVSVTSKHFTLCSSQHTILYYTTWPFTTSSFTTSSFTTSSFTTAYQVADPQSSILVNAQHPTHNTYMCTVVIRTLPTTWLWYS
jgi:hypothetical protein